MPRLLPIAILLAALPLGCSEPDDELTVFAAASMRGAMEDAAATYEASHADVDVRVVLAGSQVLRRQIVSGAPASVFVPASFDHVRSSSGASAGANADDGDVAARLEPPAVLACNRPILVVAPSSPVRRFEDLPDAERIVLGTPEVPIGAYARRILSSAERRYGAAWGRRVQAHVVSRELDVRQVLAKVTLGEADAAIVYRTDAITAGDAAENTMRRVPIPDELNVLARYPIAVVRDGPAHDEAVEFARWLSSDVGMATLEGHGFERCPTGSRGGS